MPLHLHFHFTLMRIQRCIVYIASFLSGLAGLGYEMVWARMLALTLGHEIAAVLAVLVAFFSGLALGAWFLDGRISASSRPASWYVVCEGIIGLWALLLTMLFPKPIGLCRFSQERSHRRCSWDSSAFSSPFSCCFLRHLPWGEHCLQ